MYFCRPEHAADIPAIRGVLDAAFPTRAESRLVDALRAAGRLAISIVASDGKAVVGHVAFSPVEVGGTGGIGLAPMAVVPAHQGKGVGSLLVREGLASCVQQDCGFVVVLGEPEYYGRFGFERASARGLDNEYGADEAFMVLELKAGALPESGGLVRYAPEFALVS
ncbi:MAG: N-acetyltransferase [Gammaproteobacteria bacterium]|nr:N-acetyltransferase [Gammaproteobacteria bacterium]